MDLCDYGCGQEAKHIFKNGKKCCSSNHGKCPNRKLSIYNRKDCACYQKTNCKFCNRNLLIYNLKRHEKKCKLNPKNFKYCLNCNKLLTTIDSKKFCSRSCSASYNTKNRKLSSDTKNKISKSNKGMAAWNKGIKKPSKYNNKCLVCGTIFHRAGKYCSRKCMGIDRKNSKSWSELQKQLYAEGKQYVGGGTTKWYNYKNIKVQGTYELRTCKILDEWVKTGKIKNWTYTNDRYQYIGSDRNSHTYLLDFKIFNLDGSFYYIETKGYKTETDEIKWKTIKELGYKLIVWYDEDIKKQEINLPPPLAQW